MSDYATVPLDRLIGTAELIVKGEVSAVKDSVFTIRNSTVLAGSPTSPEIEIHQYIPSRFEGTPRPVAYKAGQTFLWFLMKDEKDSGQKPWRIMGAAGEGEMPIEDGFIYFPARHVEGLASESHRVQGVQRNIERFAAEEFLDAVKKYRACFEWKAAKVGRARPTRICDQANLEQFSRTSTIHKYLTEITLNRIKND